MKSACFGFIALVFLVLNDTPIVAQANGPGRGDQVAGRNGWIFSLEEGITQAEKSGKPLMVVFRCVP